MLYTYKNITHNFEKIHVCIEHLVLHVWCKPTGTYSKNKLHPDLIPIVDGIKDPALLAVPIQEIYKCFKRIYVNDKAGFNKLKNGFIANNCIEELCKGNKTPILYSQVAIIDKSLKNKLELFFKTIYTKIPKHAAYKAICGNMKSYYDDFLDFNGAEVCPFCGITDIMTSRLTKRDAFDHYLPKDIFPFNSVNPKNLAPICKTCNSSYKLTKNPIKNDSGKTRKAFYPFAKKAVKLDITAKFTCSNISKLRKSEVSLKISNRNRQEEIESWNDLFGINERYIDKFCGKEARWWRTQILDEFKNSTKTRSKRFSEKMKLFENNYMEEKNFLKIAYFNACRKLGAI